MGQRMNRFWEIAIGSYLVGTSLVAAGCRKESTARGPVEESAVGRSGQRLVVAAALTDPRNGPHRLVARHSGKCLGVSAASKDNHARLIQWDCTGGDEQKYSFEPVGDGFYKIHPRHSGKCLGVSASGQNNGAEVIQWDCVDVQDQHFKLD